MLGTRIMWFSEAPWQCCVLTGSPAVCESWVLSTLESQMIWIQVA